MNLYANDLKNWCIPYFLPKLKTAIDLANQCPVHSGQALGAFGILDLHGLVLRNWQVPLETSFEVCLPFLYFILWEILFLYFLNVELIGIRAF